MLLSPWSRAAQRKAAPHLTGFTPISCAAKVGLSRPLNQSGHQRRDSSSKSSSPQNDAPETIAAPSGAVSKKPLSASNTAIPRKRIATRVSRQKKDVPLEVSDMNKNAAAPQVLAVPSTQHLHPHDIHVASFFSIHRPISVTSSVPSTSSSADFSTIFEPRSPPPARPSDVIYTLSSAVQTFEKAVTQGDSQRFSSAQPDESDLRTVVTQASTSNAEPSSTTHLDGQPYQGLYFNLQEITKNFRPFVVPPAPVPMEFLEEKSPKQQQQKHKRQNVQTQARTQDLQFFTTNVNKSNNHGIYTHKLPLSERLARLRLEPAPFAEPFNSDSEANDPTATRIEYTQEQKRSKWQQPFLERMRIRQQQWEDATGRKNGVAEIWRAISVKRQRKLKMKKHKYKKLMKRTRNLRRRLDKL